MTEAKRIKILNLEDSELDRMALERTVREKGLPYDLDHASTLARARVLLEREKYDVVLIDYRMPDGTGLELLKEIAHIPSIFVTGSGDEIVAVKAMKGGAYDYVIKDPAAVYLEFLPTTIEKVLGVYHLEQERKRTVETLHRAYTQLARYKTELEEAYNKLKESEERLVQSTKMASLGEMGAGIAHELNSPLAGILSLAEVLMKRIGKENPNYSFLERIADAAVRSKNIISDLLTYSQPTTNEFKPLCINETIKSTLTLFVSERKTSPLEIKEELEARLPPVLGNKGQLMEVFSNILRNARDALDSNGTQGEGRGAQHRARAFDMPRYRQGPRGEYRGGEHQRQGQHFQGHIARRRGISRYIGLKTGRPLKPLCTGDSGGLCTKKSVPSQRQPPFKRRASLESPKQSP
jgi:signal transduction histidine kinase